VVDRGLLVRNLEILRGVKTRAGCKILLAQKAFSMFYFYPLIGEYLDGTCASGLYEAKLAREFMPGGCENHVFSAAYRPHEFAQTAGIADYVIFNSPAQWELYGEQALAAGCSCGLRINPERSTQECAIYDPCSPGSRLGTTIANMPGELPAGIDGLHFHTLCEQDSDALVLTLDAVKEKFGKYLYRIKWLNLGGGHHITREGYDIELLISCVKRMRDNYGVEVYLEPGEAVALALYIQAGREHLLGGGYHRRVFV
jgi:carboxynorspermidine decarboxylase